LLKRSPELLNIHNAFHQGHYQAVLEQSIAGLSPENTLTAKVYMMRAKIACGQANDVLTELEGASEPDLIAVKAFAEYSTAKKEEAAATIEELASTDSDNTTVQVIGGIVLHLEGKSEEALSLLSKHQGSLEA
jgi:coatomer protein complex subunit epsilon